MAYDRGAVTGAQVDVLAEAKAVAPDAFTRDEGTGLSSWPWTLRRSGSFARSSTTGWTGWPGTTWPMNAIWSGTLRALNLRREQGMMRINGWVDIESGEQLAARLDPGPPLPG